MFVPAALLYSLANFEPALEPYRWWMAVGWAVLAAMLLVPQKIIHEEKSPISYVLQKIYNPFFQAAMKFRWVVLILAVAFMASAIWPFTRLGSEFMPPLDEGDLLYMPTTDPSISVTKARQVLQQTDKLIKTFPGSRQRLRQDRPRRHRHRSRPAGHDRERHPIANRSGQMAQAEDELLLRPAGLRCCAGRSSTRSGRASGKSRWRNWSTAGRTRMGPITPA